MKDIATKEIDDHVFDTNNIETSWQFKKKQNKEIRDEIRKKKDKQGGKSKVKFVEQENGDEIVNITLQPIQEESHDDKKKDMGKKTEKKEKVKKEPKVNDILLDDDEQLDVGRNEKKQKKKKKAKFEDDTENFEGGNEDDYYGEETEQEDEVQDVKSGLTNNSDVTAVANAYNDKIKENTRRKMALNGKIFE